MVKGDNQKKGLNKLKFWDTNLGLVIVSLIIMVALFIIIPLEQVDILLGSKLWLIVLFVFITSTIVFISGMSYYSYKQTKYIWLIFIVLGIFLQFSTGLLVAFICPMVFYIKNLRTKLKEENKIYS